MAGKRAAGKCMRIPGRYLAGPKHLQAVGRGPGPIAGGARPVSDGYREAFDRFFGRWK